MGELASLNLVATPIGNLGDISARATQVLRGVDFWIVEDSRVSGKLQSVLEVKKSMRVLNEHTGIERVRTYIDDLESGQRAALLTDAGTPAISDPGAALVDQCYARGVSVDAIPGPSAVTTALMLSGFYAQQYCFLGYLARKEGAIKSELERFVDSSMTLVLFESPFRVDKLLNLCGVALGSRRYAICRELTKMHQQVCRGTLPEIPTETAMNRKGEFTIVIEGKRRKREES